MAKKAKKFFDADVFLATADGGRTVSQYEKGVPVFAQGQPADAVFYIQKGKVKLTVTSDHGKEAVLAILETGDFFGEGCLIGQPLRLAAATAMTESSIMRVEKPAMIRIFRTEVSFAEKFMAHLVTRNSRVEADLVDQLFNSSEKRLARLLLLLAHYGKEEARADHGQDQPGDARRNGRDDPAPRELFHEQIQEFGFHRLQRAPGN